MEPSSWIVCYFLKEETFRPTWILFYKKEDAYSFKEGLLKREDVKFIAIAKTEWEQS